MSTFTVQRIIDAPKDLVWQKLADFGKVSAFHPMVARSHLIGGTSCGLGAKRVCEFYGGKDRAEEQITSWQEGRSMTINVLDTTLPMKRAEILFELDDAGAGSTRLTLHVQFEMKFGLLGKILGPLMMKPMMKKMMGDVLTGLDAHCRTGKRVGKNGTLLPA